MAHLNVTVLTVAAEIAVLQVGSGENPGESKMRVDRCPGVPKLCFY
jgi:hypothetical protein